MSNKQTTGMHKQIRYKSQEGGVIIIIITTNFEFITDKILSSKLFRNVYSNEIIKVKIRVREGGDGQQTYSKNSKE